MNNKHFLAILAILCIPLSGFCIDIYVPSLPAIAIYFHADHAHVQLTITSYLIGLGLSQLIAGGISDSYGRKTPFMIAMLAFMIATLTITQVTTIMNLIFLRFVQGVALGISVVPMRSVLFDLFEGPDLRKMAGYMTMAWSLGPIIAPVLGGYLQVYLGWKFSFYFLGIYSIAITLPIAYFLPETIQYRSSFHIKTIISRYLQMLTNRDYMTGLTINGLIYSCIIVFSTVGPFLIQTTLKYSPIQFGHMVLLLSLAWFLGTLTNRFIIDVNYFSKILTCLMVMLMMSLILLINALWHLPLYLSFIPLAILFWVGGIIFPNNFARSISLFPYATASGNALFGSLIFSIGGLASVLASQMKATSNLSLALLCVSLISLAFVIALLNLRKSDVAKDLQHDTIH